MVQKDKENSYVKEADLISISAADDFLRALLFYNLQADYGEEVVYYIFKHFPPVMPIEDFLRRNYELRLEAAKIAPSSFNLRKLFFAYFQKVIYEDSGEFINYKSGLINKLDDIMSEIAEKVLFEFPLDEITRQKICKFFKIEIRGKWFVFKVNSYILEKMIEEGIVIIQKEGCFYGIFQLIINIENGQGLIYRPATCEICSKGFSIAVEVRGKVDAEGVEGHNLRLLEVVENL